MAIFTPLLPLECKATNTPNTCIRRLELTFLSHPNRNFRIFFLTKPIAVEPMTLKRGAMRGTNSALLGPRHSSMLTLDGGASLARTLTTLLYVQALAVAIDIATVGAYGLDAQKAGSASGEEGSKSDCWYGNKGYGDTRTGTEEERGKTKRRA